MSQPCSSPMALVPDGPSSPNVPETFDGQCHFERDIQRNGVGNSYLEGRTAGVGFSSAALPATTEFTAAATKLLDMPDRMAVRGSRRTRAPIISP